MDKKTRRKYIQAISNHVHHKELKNARKQWGITTISMLMAIGLGAVSSNNIQAKALSHNSHNRITLNKAYHHKKHNWKKIRQYVNNLNQLFAQSKNKQNNKEIRHDFSPVNVILNNHQQNQQQIKKLRKIVYYHKLDSNQNIPASIKLTNKSASQQLIEQLPKGYQLAQDGSENFNLSTNNPHINILPKNDDLRNIVYMNNSTAIGRKKILLNKHYRVTMPQIIKFIPDGYQLTNNQEQLEVNPYSNSIYVSIKPQMKKKVAHNNQDIVNLKPNQDIVYNRNWVTKVNNQVPQWNKLIRPIILYPSVTSQQRIGRLHYQNAKNLIQNKGLFQINDMYHRRYAIQIGKHYYFINANHQNSVNSNSYEVSNGEVMLKQPTTIYSSLKFTRTNRVHTYPRGTVLMINKTVSTQHNPKFLLARTHYYMTAQKKVSHLI